MKALIELSGTTPDMVYVQFQLPQEFRGCLIPETGGLDGSFVEILERGGFEYLASITNAYNVNFSSKFAIGKDAEVNVFYEYPWQRHNLVSNVPIRTCCRNSWLKSIYLVIRRALI